MSAGAASGTSPETVAARGESTLILYGGTFDPVHEGHLAVANAVAAAAGQSVALMPAALPPHRAEPGASDRHRLAMLRCALRDQPQLRCDDRELRRQGASYTVLTLRDCIAAGERPALVLGWDAFCGLPSWREPDAIRALAILIVLPRPQPMPLPESLQAAWAARQPLSAANLAKAGPGDVLFCTMPEHPASATAIRAALHAGEPHPIGLPPAVADYIREHHLYAS